MELKNLGRNTNEFQAKIVPPSTIMKKTTGSLTIKGWHWSKTLTWVKSLRRHAIYYMYVEGYWRIKRC